MKEKALNKKPEVSSKYAQKELDRAEAKFEKFNDEVKSLTQDRMNEAPGEDVEQQTRISTKEAQKADGIWLKPVKSIHSKEKFNEKYKKEYEFAKEYVKFIAENNEVIGESICKWTKDFPGQDAEYWEIPVNKPVWGPRYLAESLKKCTYHRLHMEDKATHSDGPGTFYGTLVVDKTVHRLDAHPVSDKKSIFLGASNF